jgi:hypothetical protein
MINEVGDFGIGKQLLLHEILQKHVDEKGCAKRLTKGDFGVDF